MCNVCLFVLSVGDMPPYLSKSPRTLGGWRPRAAGESPPAASGSLLLLGTVRCYFYEYVFNVCPTSAAHVSSTAAQQCFSCLTLALLMSRVISLPVADIWVMTAWWLQTLLCPNGWVFAAVLISQLFYDTAVSVLQRYVVFLMCTMDSSGQMHCRRRSLGSGLMKYDPCVCEPSLPLAH